MTNEAFARVKIDQLLKDTDWRLIDGLSVRSPCSKPRAQTSVSARVRRKDGATPISSTCRSSFLSTARKSCSATRVRTPIFAVSKRCSLRTIWFAARAREDCAATRFALSRL